MMPSPFQLAIVLLIVLIVFGTKRIRSLGSDLGGAIREFRKGVGDDGDSPKDPKVDKDFKVDADDSAAPDPTQKKH